MGASAGFTGDMLLPNHAIVSMTAQYQSQFNLRISRAAPELCLIYICLSIRFAISFLHKVGAAIKNMQMLCTIFWCGGVAHADGGRAVANTNGLTARTSASVDTEAYGGGHLVARLGCPTAMRIACTAPGNQVRPQATRANSTGRRNTGLSNRYQMLVQYFGRRLPTKRFP